MGLRVLLLCLVSNCSLADPQLSYTVTARSQSTLSAGCFLHSSQRAPNAGTQADLALQTQVRTCMKKNMREDDKWTSFCSHVHCEQHSHQDEKGNARPVTRVHTHHEEKYGKKHICKFGMHHEEKCGCECFDESIGMDDIMTELSTDEVVAQLTHAVGGTQIFKGVVFSDTTEYPTSAPTAIPTASPTPYCPSKCTGQKCGYGACRSPNDTCGYNGVHCNLDSLWMPCCDDPYARVTPPGKGVTAPFCASSCKGYKCEANQCRSRFGFCTALINSMCEPHIPEDTTALEAATGLFTVYPGWLLCCPTANELHAVTDWGT